MPSWPEGLPDDMFLGLTQQSQDGVVRTAMDAGPPTRRQRYTAVTQNLDVPLVLTGAQRRIFDSWFDAQLLGGAVAFDWESPETDGITYSFAFRAPPNWNLRKGGTAAQRVWSTILQLERQPAGRLAGSADVTPP